jgi:hypothetical protein
VCEAQAYTPIAARISTAMTTPTIFNTFIQEFLGALGQTRTGGDSVSSGVPWQALHVILSRVVPAVVPVTDAPKGSG